MSRDSMMLRRCVVAAMCAAGVSAAHAGAAASDATMLEEVLVTAQRRSENVQDVPIAIQAFSEASLKSANVGNVRELGVIAPSLQYTDAANWVQLTLRGIGTPGIGPGIESPIALYVDDVYYAAMPASALSFNNVEAVEVINGPQGTLFGRNATGGLVHIRTKDPSATTAASLSAGYGNYETATGSFYVTGALADGVAGNLALQGRSQGKGYGRNLLTGQEIEKDDNFSARTKVVFDIGSRSKLKLTGDYSRSSVPWGTRTIEGTQAQGGSPPLGPHDTVSPDRQFSKTVQGGVAADLDVDFGGVTLTNILAWRRTAFDHQDTSDTSNLDYANAIHTQENHSQITEEIRLSSNGASAFSWTVGGYFFHEKATWDPANPYSGVNGGFFGLGPGDLLVLVDNKTESAALFGEGVYAFSPATRLTVGLRYTHETHDFSNQLIFFGAPFGYISASDPNTFAPGPGFKGKLTDDEPSARVSLAHDFSDDVMGYVSFNHGYKSGGFQAPTTDPQNPLRPEKLNAFEVGVKSQFADRRIALNVAGFYYDYTNIQVNSFVTGFPSFLNAAKAEVYGLDTTLGAAITSQFKVSASLSLLHSKFKEFDAAPHYTDVTVFPFGSTVRDASATGNELPHAPKVTFNLAPTYTVPLANGSLEFAAALAYNGGWFAEPENNKKQKAYSVMNLAGTWRSNNGLALSVWGKNVTDKDYKTVIISTTQHHLTSYGPPRTYGFTVSKDF